MSPVITFGGLLGEATEGRIVCVKSELLKQTYICRFVVSIFFYYYCCCMRVQPLKYLCFSV